MQAHTTEPAQPDALDKSPSISLDQVLPGSVPTLALLVRLEGVAGRWVFHLDPEIGWFRCDRHAEVWEPSALHDFMACLTEEEAERVAYELECECLHWLAEMRGRLRPEINAERCGLFDCC